MTSSDSQPDPHVPFKHGRPGVTTRARSELMGRVRQHGTGAEQAVALRLRARGLSYRRNDRKLPGSPDFANRRAGFAIFVHGCFWHRHEGCDRATVPRRNRAFWLEKFDQNVARDLQNQTDLRALELDVLVVWECETSSAALIDEKLALFFRRTAAHRSGVPASSGRPRS